MLGPGAAASGAGAGAGAGGAGDATPGSVDGTGSTEDKESDEDVLRAAAPALRSLGSEGALSAAREAYAALGDDLGLATLLVAM